MNNTMRLPCIYFPTKIVMVDDTEAFINSLLLHLPYKSEKYFDAEQALQSLKNYQPQITEDSWLTSYDDSDLGDGVSLKPIMLDLNKIIALKDKGSYSDISVVIIDYHMPNLTGLELLEKLRDKPFKKVLLTGEGDHQLAVTAFNSGLIDYFIRKDELDLPKKITALVSKLQWQYFVEMSNKSRQILVADSPVFANETIANLFYQFCLSKEIVALYLISLNGNYVCLDKRGTSFLFLTYTQPQLNLLADNGMDDDAPVQVVNSLRNGNCVPFFGIDKKYWEIPGIEWTNYLYEAKKVSTEQGIFFVTEVLMP